MNRLDSLISGTVAINLLLFSLSTQGADSPQATIQSRGTKNTHRPSAPRLRGPAHREDRLAKAARVCSQRAWSILVAADSGRAAGICAFVYSVYGVPVDLVYIGVRDQWPQRTITALSLRPG
jgi:hypothetical protein